MLAKRMLEDQLDILDPPYETMEELKIGRLLDAYGIPFFYKQPTVVMDQQTGQNEMSKPSFTLPQYGCSVIDYIVNTQDRSTILQTYRYNQIPAVVLGPADLADPHWQQNLYDEIDQQLRLPEYSIDQLIKL